MISEPMQDALSEQLNHEFYSAYLYLALSASCSNAEFNGAARWLETQYEEEIQHATKIYRYLIDQGVKVRLAQIDQPPAEFGALLEIFEFSLAHEQSMTARLNDLSDQALGEKDHATYNLLQWFVNEQVEEEATLGEIIAKLRLVKDDGYGLLMIDNELGTRTAAPAPE
ncbi:ferritin [Ilumatobacter sp.]|uniref:ferritin n=1 Tax=Ilumatobacter sp. TaxID=1967498 RepID=UPI003AF5C1D2